MQYPNVWIPLLLPVTPGATKDDGFVLFRQHHRPFVFYVITVFDGDIKAKVKEEQFPQYCIKAFDLGVRFVQQAKILKENP